MSLVQVAREYARNGLSVLPVLLKEKKPTAKWTEWQKRIPEESEIDDRFGGLNGHHGIAVVCGRVSGGLEVLDFDNHFGDISEVWEDYTSIQEVSDVIESNGLPYERSKSGGYHLFYRCDTVAGNTKLAEKVNPSDGRLAAFIETRGEGGYVIVAPSTGYELLTGALENVPKITEAERDILLSYARSFSKKMDSKKQGIGLKPVEIGTVTGGNGSTGKEGVQWRYNDDATDDEILGLLASEGWQTVGRVGENYHLRRPGKDHGVSATFNGKVFYCFTANGAPFEEQKGYSKYDVFLKIKHRGQWQEAYKELRVRFGIEERPEAGQASSGSGGGAGGSVGGSTAEGAGGSPPVPDFFVRRVVQENGREKIVIDYARYVEFLNENGFRKFRKEKEILLVRIKDNIVEEVEIADIQSFIKGYITRNGLDRRFLNEIISKDALWNKLKTQFLDDLPNKFLEHTKDAGWFLFGNCALKVPKDGDPEAYEYGELPLPVWKKKIRERELDLELLQDDGKSEMEAFCERVTMGNPKRKEALMLTIGYLLHSYKDPAVSKAVIFQDEEIPMIKGIANGGTGKSLIAKFIGQYRNISLKGGNGIDKMNTNFLFDLVDMDTELVVFDDASQEFPFEVIFPYVTGPMEINKKYMPRFTIPADKSPKILITTNHTIGNIGVSDERRKNVVEFGNYYGLTRTPDADFGHRLMDDWDDAERHRADRFAVVCLQEYLRKGLREYVVNAKVRLLIDKCGREFVEFMTDKVTENHIVKGYYLDKKSLFEMAKRERDELAEMSSSSFTRRLKTFFKLLNIEYLERRSDGNTSFMVGGNLENAKNLLANGRNSSVSEGFKADGDEYVM